MPKERIGIMGGSFNPIHDRHLAIAACALNEARLDRILFLPTGNPPHKHPAALADAEHRFEMTRLATLRAMSIACTARLALGESPVVEASLVKDLGTGFEQELPIAIGDDLASHPDEPVDAELYRALLYVTQIAPSFSLRGGTREVLRGVIARGLGLR